MQMFQKYFTDFVKDALCRLHSWGQQDTLVSLLSVGNVIAHNPTKALIALIFVAKCYTDDLYIVLEQ